VSTSRLYALRCDGCGIAVRTEFERADQARQHAESIGWRVRIEEAPQGGYRVNDYCERCPGNGPGRAVVWREEAIHG
jgi:hypothetical protein